MPKVVNEPFDWSKYPIAQCADGQIWEFTKGTDYNVTESTYINYVRGFARENGYDLKVRVEEGKRFWLKLTKQPAAIQRAVVGS